MNDGSNSLLQRMHAHRDDRFMQGLHDDAKSANTLIDEQLDPQMSALLYVFAGSAELHLVGAMPVFWGPIRKRVGSSVNHLEG